MATLGSLTDTAGVPTYEHIEYAGATTNDVNAGYPRDARSFNGDPHP